jgi:hypothetical protein
MAEAVAQVLEAWELFLSESEKVSFGEIKFAVLIFTDEVQVHKCTTRCWHHWLTQRCTEHSTGDLLEARLFKNDLEVLLRREDEKKWLCRLISDQEANADEKQLVKDTDREVYIWGERLNNSSIWYEERMKPIELPLEGNERIAVAKITVYKRNDGRSVWRFTDLYTKGAV